MSGQLYYMSGQNHICPEVLTGYFEKVNSSTACTCMHGGTTREDPEYPSPGAKVRVITRNCAKLRQYYAYITRVFSRNNAG